MRISKLIIEDVRCFKGRHEFEIKPLTFITGGNNTGKSTILACWQVLADWLDQLDTPNADINFNIPPYLMGSFDDIVRRARPKLTQFAIGFEMAFDIESATLTSIFRLKEQAKGSVPEITEVEHTLKHKKQKVLLTEEYADAPFGTLGRLFPFAMGERLLHGSDSDPKEVEKRVQEQYGRFISLLKSIRSLKYSEGDLDTTSYNALLATLSRNIAHLLGNVVSVAPISVSPQRTYNHLIDFDSSQGDDMPMVLRDMATHEPTEWCAMQQQLQEFGIESGMFKKIEIKKSANHHFQIKVQDMYSLKSNPIDMGYGANKIIPILVRVIGASQEGLMCLMQQPETHLHPQGQAALTSFLINLIGTPHKDTPHDFFAPPQRISSVFVVETHSDNMIDRARIHVVKNQFKPENLSIVHLEAKNRKDGVQESNITVDAQGNIEGFPDGYREFFMRETNKLLGFE